MEVGQKRAAHSRERRPVCSGTRFALSTSSERGRIEALTVLSGVDWPTASVILHLYHEEQYPILDVRALWSVRANLTRAHDFEFWVDYVYFCRVEAAAACWRATSRLLAGH